MTVYVDETRTYPPESFTNKAAMRFGFDWCHMWADTEAELHAMAARIGVPRSAYQGQYARPQFRHYDLIPAKRAKAIKAGAVFMGARERGNQIAAEIERQTLAVIHGEVMKGKPGESAALPDLRRVPEKAVQAAFGIPAGMIRIEESPGAEDQLQVWRL